MEFNSYSKSEIDIMIKDAQERLLNSGYSIDEIQILEQYFRIVVDQIFDKITEDYTSYMLDDDMVE